ncbi:sensor histidine kinase, PAS domain-containing [Geotalea daltonii FRC-32]|uniref:histidine kinase n=1 Tax=Geotalea daltonii (strain DSM 22248 / JCM 15807 / FRC-32) TaxID=316067 RepID=B9M7M0_GEODF|nr:ATP-binding protein [Geotalea daltonii]ACM22126.1 sensor histidine kinase, PAS domain-containing [Geotalea daltonii FRC-32]
MGADKEQRLLTEAAKLRSHAEERLQARTAELHPPRSKEEMQRLVHELEVHQIELEMQNAELRQARDEVETVLEKYTDLYDFAPVGYFTLDPEGTIRAVNLTGASLLGVERSRLLGRRFGVFVPINARSFFSELLGKVFASQGKMSREVTLTREENHPLFVQIEAVADISRKECRVAVIDITERRIAEDALTEKRRELEELNRSLEVRIVKAVDEVRRKDEMLILQDRLAVMGEMINNIAHQWRQPLNSLGLLTQQLPIFYDSGKLSREFLVENTVKGMELIQHMSRTIDDFRNFFRSDKEKVTFSVNQLTARTLSLVEKSFKDQKIGIALNLEGDPILTGYPNEYAQVLLNIFMNARDALLSRSVDNALISIHAFAEGGKTVVTITDNAGGVAEEIMGKLFDPYFTTKGPDKGTGIGLFMSKTIVEKNMGGRLTVRNTGNGAEFRIEI